MALSITLSIEPKIHDVAVRQSSLRGIGWAIRKVRTAQKRTLEQVAEAIGSDAGNLSRIEKGKQRITDHMLIDVAGALGVTASDLWLITERGDEELATLVGKMGQLDATRIQETERYVDYLLSRQPD